MPIALTSSFLGDIPHGFFTRHGGVSTGIYQSLNIGKGSNDTVHNVDENRQRIKTHLGANTLITPHQIHSAICYEVSDKQDLDQPREGDAIVTTSRRLAIGILTADCTPILCADLKNGVIGAAHAGWRGATSGVITAMADMMRHKGADIGEMRAVIGPCIQMPNYEVGEEFYDNIYANHENGGRYFERHHETNKWHFNLSEFCSATLDKLGIAHETLPNCTYNEADSFFSYRRSQHVKEADYGRHGSFIMLP